MGRLAESGLRRRQCCVFVAASVWVAPFVVCAQISSQPASLNDSVAQLRYALLQLELTSKSALAVTPSDVKRAKGEVNDFISWLEAQEIPSADVAGIRDSLEYYKLGIDQIRSSQDSLNSALWLAKIGADARSKRKYFSQNMGASSGSAFVEISVRTKSDAPPQEVTNITVGYILDGYPFEDIRYRRMLSASTPVVGFRILPGEYVFFALKADKVIGRKVTQIGLSGVNSTDVDIPVVGN